MTVSPWPSLLKKDFRLALPWFLGGLGLIIAFDLWFAWSPHPEVRLAFSSMLVFAHIIYFPVYLFISLWVEGKQMHQWLHSPRPAWQLILSKLVVGIPFILLSLSISGLYPTYLVLGPTDLFASLPGLDPTAFWSDVGLMLMAILWISFHLSLLLLVVWSVYRWLRTYLGKWTWLLTGAGFFFFLYLYSKWVTSHYYELLFQWGPTMNIKGLTEGQTSTPFIHTGDILFDLLLAAAFFTLAQWILEKRMEV